MNNSLSIWLVAILFIATAHPAVAQQPAAKAPRIGFLAVFPQAAFSARLEGFRQGLHQVGLEEGNNISVEYRYADGKIDRLEKLTQELVELKVELIVTHGDAAIRAIKRIAPSMPIVVGVTGDLVESGHAKSLARPGGKVTGFVDTSPDLSGKRLEILKEVKPKATHVGVIWNGANPIKKLDFEETQTAARAFGVRLESLDVRGPEPIENKLRTAAKTELAALVVLQDAWTVANAKKIVEFTQSTRLPAMYGSTEFVEVGGLMSYAANFPDLFRRAAHYVEKILKGANPGELPVQQPVKFEFVVNLKAAKQIGLTIPPNVLARADRVIK